MNRLFAGLRYVRDVAEVLILDRVTGPSLQRERAGEAATIVRSVRFHAHAKIPNLQLSELVSRLGSEPVLEVTLVGPREQSGVGSGTYYHALASIARATKPLSVLEFGTYLGIGTLTMALNVSPNCRIITLDLPDDPQLHEEHDLSQGDLELIERRRARVGEAFLHSERRSQIEQIRTDSLTWQPDDSLGSIDLVLVDGGHSEPLVRADTENAFKLLSPTGTIVWDDYFYLYPGVVSYLDSLMEQGLQLYAIRGTNLVIHNPRLQ